MESHTFKALKTLLIITTSLMCSAICLSRAARSLPPSSTDIEFIRQSCSVTIYPILCFSSLSCYASAIQQDPKLLACTALSLSLETTRVATIDIVNLAHGLRLSPLEAGAMQDCMEELSDSVDQLKGSMVAMNRIKGRSDFGMIISDVQTWVSAALTNEDTCMDGFSGNTRNGAARALVRAKIVNVVHTTSNALALINSYAAIHS